MSARAILKDLERWGVTVEAHGTDLIVDGPADVLTDGLVASLRAAKADLLAALRPAAHEPQEPEGWQAYFDERAAMREYEGSLPRAEAERLAFEDAVAHWLSLNPPSPAPSDVCVHCSQASPPETGLVHVVTAAGRTWVHEECYGQWLAQRRQQAGRALRSILPPLALAPTDASG